MVPTNLNIRTDKEIKEQAEAIFSELGLNMSTALNIFLRKTIKENGIPFDLKLNKLNKDTVMAIDEGRKILYDKNTESYSDIDELRNALKILNAL